MKVKIVFDLNLEERKAISNYYGDKRPANHKKVHSFITAEMNTIINDLAHDLEMGCSYELEKQEQMK